MLLSDAAVKHYFLINRQAEEMRQYKKKQESTKRFQELLKVASRDLISNTEDFDCPICFDHIEKGNGIVLMECLHTFCRECLASAISISNEPVLSCPYQDGTYRCDAALQDREVKALVSREVYNQYLMRSIRMAESQAENSYHCKTTDCQGWCIYEDNVNFFVCPVCKKENCLTCKHIHEGMNCKQYQEDLMLNATKDIDAKKTKEMLQRLVTAGEAMHCPKCQIIVQKKDGCDWIKCSICKTEICWVTRGPRWGPKGEGDTSAGCGCRINGKSCHALCNNCH